MRERGAFERAQRAAPELASQRRERGVDAGDGREESLASNGISAGIQCALARRSGETPRSLASFSGWTSTRAIAAAISESIERRAQSPALGHVGASQEGCALSVYGRTSA